MKAIIFDFDGTIADSFGEVIALIHELTGTHERMTDKEIERLRGMSAYRVARELEIKPWKIPFLVAKGRRLLRKEMSKISVFPGITDVIQRLSEQGHKLYIMSSNSVQNIHELLEREALDNEFIKIYGGVGLFGKARVLKKIIRQNQLRAGDTYYVGDEVRDIEGAQRAGVHIISVAWGYNNAQALAAHKPDWLIKTPQELLRIAGKQPHEIA